MPRVLLIGWDGAGWKHIHPLLDAGAMPNLARMVETGVMGDLAALSPLCSPLLWTSASTGMFADRHGVLDTVETDPVSSGLRPVTRASLSAEPVWDLLAREGVNAQVLGWPATHPAEGPATCVSDGFVHGVPGSIFPEPLAATLAPLRFSGQEWTGADLKLFIPMLGSIDQDRDKRLARLAVALAEAVTTQAAATSLMESEDAQFTAIWFGTIARAIVIFPTDTDEIYREAVSGVYRFLDLMLGRLLELAGPQATTILISDRSAGEPEWQASTGHGSRPIFCASGPGIAHDELAFGAGLLDIAPTVLGLFGFSRAEAMAGHPIPEICTSVPTHTLQTATSFVATKAEPAPEIDLAELEDLGYVDSVEAAMRPAVEAARLRRDLHLAQVLFAQHRAVEAVPILEARLATHPSRTDVRVYLAHAYHQAARYPECKALCEALLAESPDSPLAPLAWAHIAIFEGNFVAARKHLASAHQGYGIAAGLDTAIGHAYLRIEDWENAAAAFRSSIAADPWAAAAHEGLAQAMLAQQLYTAAAGAALDATRLSYDRPAAHHVLGTALRALGHNKMAAGAFATSQMLSSRAFTS